MDYSARQAFHSALEGVTKPAFRIDPVLAERAHALWGNAEDLERALAMDDYRRFGETTRETYEAIADAYLVAADAYAEADNFFMVARMESLASTFRRLALRAPRSAQA